MKKPTIIIDEFLDDNDCNELVRLFNDNRILVEPNTANKRNRFLNIGENKPIDHNIVKKVWSKLNSTSLYTVHWAQIYEWSAESSMKMHKDLASKHTAYTSVLYLNDNFTGGKTYFEDGTTFIPKKGKVLFYDGVENTHGVTEVKNGTRYTLAAWFKNNPFMR